MKILIAGGAGFMGSHIVEAALAAGHQVAVVDDLSTGFAAGRPEVVCHQAARANVRESFEKPLLYAGVNVLGSLNLLEQCRRHGVRKVVYASTGYGQAAVRAPSKAGEVSRMYLDARRASASLGWEPQISLADGLASTVDFFRARAA